MAGYLFETIAANLEQEISGGTLAVGTKLPSERTMAERLGVSHNVIREAIRVLEETGRDGRDSEAICRSGARHRKKGGMEQFDDDIIVCRC